MQGPTLAHQERTGALIIAEGVETDNDLEQALAMGADLAQGYRFGQAALLGRRHRAAGPPPKVRAERRGGGSAHSAAEDDRVPLRVARKDVVAAFSHHIEEQARHSVDRPMVLAASQRVEHYETRRRPAIRVPHHQRSRIGHQSRSQPQRRSMR